MMLDDRFTRYIVAQFRIEFRYNKMRDIYVSLDVM